MKSTAIPLRAIAVNIKSVDAHIARESRSDSIVVLGAIVYQSTTMRYGNYLKRDIYLEGFR
jgi:hypothetical protein